MSKRISLRSYNGKGVWQVFHWAYILPQATAHRLHSNSLANLSIYCFAVDQLILLPPTVSEKEEMN